MKNVLIAALLLFYSGQSFGFGCSDEKKEEVEQALFNPASGEPAIYKGSERNPTLWITVKEVKTLESMCKGISYGSRTFDGSLAPGITCGYRVWYCTSEPSTADQEGSPAGDGSGGGDASSGDGDSGSEGEGTGGGQDPDGDNGNPGAGEDPDGDDGNPGGGDDPDGDNGGPADSDR